MLQAHDLFDEVLIAPHLDDGTKTGHWRNMLLMDPEKKDKYGFSYVDIMIKPILSAVKAVYNTPGKRFLFGMQGEMGGTVFFHPDGYSRIAAAIRAQYKGPAQVKVGVTFNHGYMAGVINRENDEHCAIPVTPKCKLDGAFGKLLPLDKWPHAATLKANKPALGKLFDSVDFFGVSNYARAPEDVKPEHIESSAAKQEAELAILGFNLKAMYSKPGKFYIMNEFAIGGGISECGNVKATNGRDAGLFPWLGSTVTYTQATDPWENYKGPNARVPARDYMRKYYQAALKLLSTGGQKYKFSGAYLWNVVSWDIQGIHPASWENGDSNSVQSGRSFADPVTMAMIRDHNAKYSKKPNTVN